MADIVVGIAAEEGAKGAVGVIGRHFQYYTRCKENVEEFQSQMKVLKAKQVDLQGKVDAARRNQDEPLQQVLQWLEDSVDVISQCDELQKQIGKNTGRHYWLGRKVVKMMETIKKFTEKCNFVFTTVACNPPPPRIEFTATQWKEGLDTMEEAKKQVMDALWDVDVSVIGVYGMGGVGKTTLMQMVNNELEKSSDLFNKVIMVTVSSNPDIKTLQDQIARRLGLEFDKNKEVSFRAHTLSERLKTEGSVLIILDDVWEKLETDQVGVPCASGSRCCRIVLTTRDEKICKSNNAQSMIYISVLTEEESWKLFRLKAGEVVDRDEIKSIAEMGCRECAGLPLAISAVASSLKNEDSVRSWKRHLKYLKESEPAKIKGLTKKVINPLRLSYDLLHTKELKLCFLTCSLFPEDHKIDVRDLMYYGIGEGFVEGGEEERLTLLDDCRDLVDTLKSRGLLLHVDEGDKKYARMHDVVRDVAISIGKEDGTYGMYVKAGVPLTEWPEQTELQGRKRLSFMKSTLPRHLPGQPRFDTDIKSLLLCYTYSGSFSIPDGFFENMRDLLILDLRYLFRVSSPPSSLRYLEKLRVFLFSSLDNELIGLDVLSALKNLVVLSLNYIPIVELPEEFGGLVHLKILDLTGTQIKIIKPNVLSKLSRLEELHMWRSFDQWEACNDATGEASTLVQHDRQLASFSELASLKKLKVLQVDVRNGEIFSQDIVVSTLKMFYISYVLEDYKADYDPEPTQLILRSPARLAPWVKLLMTKAAKLTLFDCQEEDIIVDYLTALGNSSAQPFRSLTVLKIKKCNKLVVVSKFSEFPVLPNLERLRVASCETLKDVFKYSPTKQAIGFAEPPEQQEGNITSSRLPAGSFQNLKWIKIRQCHSLCYLFTWSMAKCLVQLEELEVSRCNALKIISEEGNDDTAHVFPRLKVLTLRSLPMLESMCRFPQQPLDWSSRLEDLYLLECPRLKSSFLSELSGSKINIFEVTKEWFETLEWEDEHVKNKWKNKVTTWREESEES